ncbi:hypothetical protein L6164_019366 [Bauhinia variegata]|uniref:Uncharacterized protein n=1 Tax=Bauhinia variegata TaxID=167791 RepID=A0ACB9MV12_BAUVA|nr:hypothetical protein L6164_019366 [Bauhinia variegata]
MGITLPLSPCKSNNFVIIPSTVLGSPPILQYGNIDPLTRRRAFWSYKQRRVSRKRGIACGLPLPVDPWSPTVDSQSIASQLFAFSLFPYIGFLYYITKSKSAPKLTLFGFYFLLAFVGATIPAGIYAKVQYGTSLSNVDWLHGGAESLLTLTNLFIVLGLREGLRKAENSKQNSSTPYADSELKE